MANKSKKIKKVAPQKVHDLVKLGVAPEDMKDFQRVIGGGFLMDEKQIKTAYAEYKKAQALNIEEHLEMVFMIPKIQGSLTEGGIVTAWSGTREAFNDPMYMNSVLGRVHTNLLSEWKKHPYFTQPALDTKAKTSRYGYWSGQPLESFSVPELCEILRTVGGIAKHAKNKNAEGLELI